MERAVVGRRIRELRERRGISGKDFARQIGLSPAAISKLERGLLRPTEAFIENAIETLALTKHEAIALREIGALFNSQFRRWSTGAAELEANQKLIAQRERNARTIRSFWNSIVPGLLQTEAYMREVLKTFATDSGAALEKVITARRKRQDLLLQQRRTFVFVLGEACLRTRLGSETILHSQLIHLARVISEYRNVELRILPFEKVLTRVPFHHFIIYDERTVEVEINKGQLDLWTDEDVQFHIDLMNYFVADSLPPAKSLELISSIQRTLRA